MCSFGIIKLPSLYSVRNASMTGRQKPGICHDYLLEQQKAYSEYKTEQRKKGGKDPLGIGVLIFDEVKIINKLIWNNKTNAFVGIAMEESEYAFIKDVFTPHGQNKPRGAKYVLQFLWRDLTSKYDLIGPYFMSPQSVDHVFLTGCLFETMRALHAYDFRIICLACDGASTNMTVLKHTLGITGTFPIDTEFRLNVSFDNPFETGMKCHWIICRAHQLKNLVFALHSSRPTGAKYFIRNDIHFGWSDIVVMKVRDDQRFKDGQLRFVQGLLQSYIERDSWIRLNVKPAKILQQEQV